MLKSLIVIFNIFICISFSSAGSLSNSVPSALPREYEGDGKNHKHFNSFIKNNGQIRNSNGEPQDEILFYSRQKGMDIYFFNNKISYVLKKRNCDTDNIELHRVDLSFSGSNSNISIQSGNPSTYLSHYFFPSCPDGILGVKSFSKLTYYDLYPGIDLIFYADELKGLKYDFVVAPGADIGAIQMVYEGEELVELTQKNELKITTGLGSLMEEIPLVYQVVDNKKIEIEAKYIVQNNIISFDISTFDHARPLVIDPWATFLGGTDIEEGKGIGLDSNGNIYVTGITSGTDFPVSPGAFQASNAGNYDAFVSKYDSSGNKLWSTYYGGSGNDFASKLKVDNSGNIIFCGHTTSTDFPLSSAAWQMANAGGYDAFLVKLDAAGNRIWSTYIGGSGGELGIDVATDSANNILFGGQSGSLDFPITTGAFQTSLAGAIDAIVCKFNASGNMVWGTYYGGNNAEDAHCITVDNSNNIIIAGGSNSTNLSTTPGALQSTLTGSFDIYILKLDNNGNRLWSTYFGGSNYDDVFGISTDSVNNIYFGGNTNSIDFPVTGSAYQTTNNGSFDACIFKLAPSGNLTWCTYFGGALNENVERIKTDALGNSFLLLYTNSTNMPIVGTPVQASNGGGNDLFLAKINSSGTPAWSTYYGGTADDFGLDLEVDNSMNVFMTGHTYSTDFPVMGNSFQPAHGGDIDAFVLNINGSQDITVGKEPQRIFRKKIFDLQLFPNPADEVVLLQYTLNKKAHIKIELTDIQGTGIIHLKSEFQNPGLTKLSINIKEFTPGIYLLHWQSDDEIITKKIIKK